MEFSSSSLCDEELSSHVCQQTSRQQQNIFCCHDNQPGPFLCSTSKSYSDDKFSLEQRTAFSSCFKQRLKMSELKYIQYI